MKMLEEIYVKSFCSVYRKPFFVKYNKGADGVWVRMQGLREIQFIPESEINKTNPSIDLVKIRVSPRYKCPYCNSASCGSALSNSSNPIEIMLVFDISGSMGATEISQSKEAAKKLIENVNLNYTSIGMVAFTVQKKLIFSPSHEMHKLQGGVLSYDKTNLGAGTSAIPFDIAFQAFSDQTSKKYFILLTDGKWEDQNTAIENASIYKRKNVEIIAVGFGSADKRFLESLASSPKNVLMTSIDELAKSFSDFSVSIIFGAGQ